MPITVKPIGHLFGIKLTYDGEEILFKFKQLDYKTKAMITSQVTTVKQGNVSIDSLLTVFLNIKHGLKDVDGLVDAEEKPYELEFEDKQKTALTDKCVDELLATELSNSLQFAARELNNTILPKEIVNPLTGVKFDDIDIVPPEKLAVAKKK